MTLTPPHDERPVLRGVRGTGSRPLPAVGRNAPKAPGKFWYPPLAAVITSGTRLLLALLECCVTDEGGTWATADTDSMGIVAAERSGLIDCPGRPYRKHGEPAVRARTHYWQRRHTGPLLACSESDAPSFLQLIDKLAEQPR